VYSLINYINQIRVGTMNSQTISNNINNYCIRYSSEMSLLFTIDKNRTYIWIDTHDVNSFKIPRGKKLILENNILPSLYVRPHSIILCILRDQTSSSVFVLMFIIMRTQTNDGEVISIETIRRKTISLDESAYYIILNASH